MEGEIGRIVQEAGTSGGRDGMGGTTDAQYLDEVDAMLQDGTSDLDGFLERI